MTDKTDEQKAAGMKAGADLQNKLAAGATTDPAYIAAANSAGLAVHGAALALMEEAHPPSFIANGMLFEAVKIMVNVAVAANVDLGVIHDQLHAMACDAFQTNVRAAHIRQHDLQQKMQAWFSTPAGHA